MVAFYILRLVIAIYSTQVFASAECVKLNLESGEIAHGKPITASSTCEAFETYCYLRGKIEFVFYPLYERRTTVQHHVVLIVTDQGFIISKFFISVFIFI